MNVLYAGDSPAGGPANYLLAILKYNKAITHHLPPGQKMSLKDLKKKYDLIIFSDYGVDCLGAAETKQVVKQVQWGAGLLMVGGWGSFSGPFGQWKGSAIEALLPVKMSSGDDRLNFPSGALLMEKAKHAATRGVNFSEPPAICGLNRLTAKTGAQTLVTVRPVQFKSYISLSPKDYPLLVVSSATSKLRTAAFASDFAPHWCGGMVDWGRKRMVLPVNDKIRVEVGDRYVQFISRLLLWLAKKS